jgi:hypothetical protein
MPIAKNLAAVRHEFEISKTQANYLKLQAESQPQDLCHQALMAHAIQTILVPEKAPRVTRLGATREGDQLSRALLG